MSERMLRAVGLSEHASEAASHAATKARVEIRALEARDELIEASRLAALVWDDDGVSKVPSELLRAFAHAGNYVVGAFASGDMVAFSVGFLGLEAGAPKLHSHITGVHPSMQGRAIGFALKQHQRAWALGSGIHLIEWTTDPLVRRNGYFNLQKLGAQMVAYHVNFYGELADGLNAGEESDRVVVRWELDDARVQRAGEGALPEPSGLDDVHAILTDDGAAASVVPATEGALRAWVPPDIVGLRSTDPGRARAWRLAARGTLGAAMQAGYRVEQMSRDGWYVLTR